MDDQQDLLPAGHTFLAPSGGGAARFPGGVGLSPARLVPGEPPGPPGTQQAGARLGKG